MIRLQLSQSTDPVDEGQQGDTKVEEVQDQQEGRAEDNGNNVLGFRRLRVYW